MEEMVLQYNNVSKKYTLGEVEISALTNISLSIGMREFTAIVGPSGSGKSTLLHLGASLDKPSTGTITLLGKEISLLNDKELSGIRNQSIGFIFQSFNLIPVLNVYENIEYPCLVNSKNKGYNVYIEELLDEIDMTDKKKKRPGQLSGGERQRVAIARALVNKPKIVFADEPTANLDHKTGDIIMKLMIRLNEKYGTTFFFSTHDPEIMKLAKRIIRMKDGEIVKDQC